jgi:hypothetical protein
MQNFDLNYTLEFFMIFCSSSRQMLGWYLIWRYKITNKLNYSLTEIFIY